MKKLFMMTVVALMATMSLHAQSEYYSNKHEVAVSYGVGANSQLIDVFETLGVVLTGVSMQNESVFGSLSVEYFYRPNKWLGVGGILCYGQSTHENFSHVLNEVVGEGKNTYYTVMPAAKFDWLRKKNFGLYSKLAIGATYRHETEEAESQNDYDDGDLHVNWQVSLLGVEAGSESLRGFVELGTGEQGILLAGVRCKF